MTTITSTITWNSGTPKPGWYLAVTNQFLHAVHALYDGREWLMEDEDGYMTQLTGVRYYAEMPESPLLQPVGKGEYPY